MYSAQDLSAKLVKLPHTYENCVSYGLCCALRSFNYLHVWFDDVRALELEGAS